LLIFYKISIRLSFQEYIVYRVVYYIEFFLYLS